MGFKIKMSYRAFGSPMPTRVWSDLGSKYKFGFNGKEKDDDINVNGGDYDYGFRIYDSRLGRFFKVDPLTGSYPWYTPYQFAGNKPVWAIDLDGLEEFLTQQFTLQNSKGRTFIYKLYWKDIDPSARIVATMGTVVMPRDQNFRQYNSVTSIWENTSFTTALVTANRSIIQPYPNSTALTLVRNSSVVLGSGTLTIMLSPKVLLGDDQGKTKEELESKLVADNKLDDVDDIASTLVNDPNSKVVITGSASKKPTDIDGTKPEISEANNLELASSRATAGKEVLIGILKTKYGQTDAQVDSLMSRVELKSEVNGNAGDSEQVAKTNRYVKYDVR